MPGHLLDQVFETIRVLYGEIRWGLVAAALDEKPQRPLELIDGLLRLLADRVVQHESLRSLGEQLLVLGRACGQGQCASRNRGAGSEVCTLGVLCDKGVPAPQVIVAADFQALDLRAGRKLDLLCAELPCAVWIDPSDDLVRVFFHVFPPLFF